MSDDQNEPQQWNAPGQPQPAPGYGEQPAYQPQPQPQPGYLGQPTNQPQPPVKSHTGVIIASIVAVLVVGVGAAGIAVALPFGGDSKPTELSARQYTNQLCAKTAPVVESLPPSGSLNDSSDTDSSGVEGARDKIVENRKFLVAVKELVEVEQKFAEAHTYAGTGGKDLKKAIAAGSPSLRRALAESVDVIDRMSAKFEEFLKIDGPTIDDSIELKDYIAEQKARLATLLPEMQELPGDSTALFAAAQVADEPIGGNLEKALESLDEAAHSSDACQPMLDWEM